MGWLLGRCHHPLQTIIVDTGHCAFVKTQSSERHKEPTWTYAILKHMLILLLILALCVWSMHMGPHTIIDSLYPLFCLPVGSNSGPQAHGESAFIHWAILPVPKTSLQWESLVGREESTEVCTVNNETMFLQDRDALLLTRTLYVKSLRLTTEETAHGHCILLRRTFPTGPEILVLLFVHTEDEQFNNVWLLAAR